MRIKPFIPLAILFFLITGGITYLITHFFITPKYESTAVIYTPNTHANIHLVSTVSVLDTTKRLVSSSKSWAP
jgi:glucan phosphoethanolaminetransferase (alkaline phosphatase superfamily)